MVGINFANAHLGIPCCEKNGVLASYNGRISYFSCAFSILQKPVFGIELRVKDSKKIHVIGFKLLNCGAINALSKVRADNDTPLLSGGILEKELEFKPSFDEYLRAMESVKTGRNKKQPFDSNKRRVKDKSSEKSARRTSFSEGSKGNSKTREVDHSSDEENLYKVVKQRDLFKIVDGAIGRKGFVRDKFNGKEKGMEERNEFEISRQDCLDAEGNSRLGRETIKGKRLNHDSSRVKSDSNFSSNSNLANNNWSNRRGEVEFDRYSSETRVSSGPRGYSKSTEKTIRDRNVDFKTHVKRNNFLLEKVGDNKFVKNFREIPRSNKKFLEGIDYNGLEVERAAFRNFDELNDVMDKPRVPKMEMEERIQMLAKRLNGADIDMPEWIFAKMMRSAKIRYTDHSILRVIQILGKLGNWRRVLQVIEWLQLRERFKSHKLRFIYTTALDVLGKARRPVEALNIFHAMQQHFSSYPDLVAYHTIAVTLGQAGHMRELFDVIDGMRSPPKKKFKTGALEKWDPRLEPDIVIYNAVLNACIQRKQWEGAFWVIQQLKQRDLQPSTTTYGLVMEVMFACGKYNLVHEFFRKVPKSSIPNALTYKVLVNTLWREGKTDEAVLAVQDMERRGIVGSAGLYYDLARCLCSAGRCEEALMQIKKVCKVASKPLVVTYTGLIQACLESGDIQSGAHIFNQMKDFCSPNLVTCNIMLKGYLDHGMFKEAKDLFQKMAEDKRHISSISDLKFHVVPDVYTFNIMLDTSFADKRWDDFGYVYRSMLHHGYHFNAKRHLRMILEASRAGEEELLETTWKHLIQTGRIPPPPLMKERFCTKLAKGDYTTALSSITKYEESDLHLFSNSAWLNLLKENAPRFGKGTVFILIQKLENSNARRESPHPVCQNLLWSCKEFCRSNMTLADIKLVQTSCISETESALISH